MGLEYTIYKYEIKHQVPNEVDTELEVPMGSRMLSCGHQKGKVVLWFLVPVQSSTNLTITFCTRPTGHIKFELEENEEFVDTVQLDVGLVIHVFKKNNGRW